LHVYDALGKAIHIYKDVKNRDMVSELTSVYRYDDVDQGLAMKMQMSGVIEPSTSGSNGPLLAIVLVQKKDGTMHFCVDYH